MKPSVEYALAKSKEKGLPLPPGEWVNINQIEWKNRRFLLDQSKQLGPIFKALCWDGPWICIVGLKESQKFIRENDAYLTPQTLRLQPLFPLGFLRQMKGETHQKYRRALVRAIDPIVFSAYESQHRQMIEEELDAFYTVQQETNNLRDAFIPSLNRIASGLLIQIFFGARYGSENFKKLMHLYHALGPNGLEWQIGDQQRQAFSEIRECINEQINVSSTSRREWLPESIIEQMRTEGPIDETMLGNLIYMVEMGRYDMYSLFRWLAKFAADSPEWIDRIGLEGDQHSATGKTPAEAFVLETLRLEQSERLLRTVEEDIEFGGYLIPKHATVRLCLWEAHKLPTAFPEPFEFKPQRFLDNRYSLDQYAPFGLGIHKCPLADVAIRMGTLLLKVMAENFAVEPLNDGPPIRGMYHWEPAYPFAVRLVRKSA